MSFTICVAGLGLMGASLAQALRGFRIAQIIGTDINPTVREKALKDGMVSAVYENIEDAAAQADLLIFCVYARHIPALLQRCIPHLKAGCLITDICGVKTSLYQTILPALPPTVRHIGIHPMAGKEQDGIANATAALYENSSLLICPTALSTPDDIQLMQELASHIGCSRTKVVPYNEHDALIAYTSDLMHVASAGLCLRYPPHMDLAFTAGAFRDCTRVANINAEAWTELLLDNRQNTLQMLDVYIESLHTFADAIRTQNATQLTQLLQQAGDNKREMLKR